MRKRKLVMGKKMVKIHISASLAINPKFVLRKINQNPIKSCYIKRDKLVFIVELRIGLYTKSPRLPNSNNNSNLTS